MKKPAPVRAPQDILELTTDVYALSVRDLLEARDLYHNHLLHKKNVVGTAIGLYLRRPQDPRARLKLTPRERDRNENKSKGERTFANSRVRDDSWPCVLVFVTEWIKRSEFRTGGKVNPRHMIPPALYMPDGRVVPVCVMKVVPAVAAHDPLPRLRWPDTHVGGGFPLLAEAQGRERVASLGCLVTDGHTTYALTNRHVTGPAGSPVHTQLRGARIGIGKASEKQITRMPFTKAYPRFAGSQVFLNVDVGLVEVDDVNDWTSQVYGIGRIGELADLSEQNISLRLVDQEVIAYGAASGLLRGQIKALFYRHKSVGGYDYVSDFLIAPDPKGRQTLPGDSGTVWHLPAGEATLPRPLALQWGAQALVAGAGEQPLNFALATSLSTVCRELDVELVREHNTGAAPFWGVTGHYSIATFAIRAVRAAKLKKLMTANEERVSFEVGEIDPDELAEAMRDAKETGKFVQLADVPDVIWKQYEKEVTGGRDPRPRSGPEHPVHYADIDEPRPIDNKTLRELSLADPANVSVAFWQAFYDEVGHTDPGDQGLLPFRVWQFFDEMVDAAKKKDVARFVCAAGILSHYVGDACQTLHGSQFADGFKAQTTEVPMTHNDGTPGTKKVWPGKGIHSAYESAMIDRKSTQLLAGLQAAVTGPSSLPLVTNGHGAAVAIVKLMDRSAVRPDPSVLINRYVALGGGKSGAVLDALWTDFGALTIATMADGAKVLAMLWDSAWAKGSGNSIAQSKLKLQTKTALKTIYRRKTFVESFYLNDIGTHLL